MNIRKIICGILVAILMILPFGSSTVCAADEWPQGPNVNSESAILMEANTGTILYEKNMHQQHYPASITKIMTSLLAIENCSLNEDVTFSYDSVFNIERTSTHISRDVGEIMTMEQCLYAVMLGSANDCAYAVAEHTGGSYDAFVTMMNEKAKEVGCLNTNFKNPHGLPDDEHYTSAYDMAMISKAALENETFRMITKTKTYTIPFTNKHPKDETYVANHHKMVTNYQGTKEYLYEHCIGGKTGYTQAAQFTLVTFAEKDGMTLICVVMRTDGVSQYTDTRALFDWGFENFSMWNISENEAVEEFGNVADPEIFGQAENVIKLDETSKIILPNTATFKDATYEIVKNGESTELEYTYGGKVVGTGGITTAIGEVEDYPFKEDSTQDDVPVDNKEPEKEIVIDMKKVLIYGGIALIILIVGFWVYYFISHFYVIRRRMGRGRRGPYKEIKSGKRTKWKSRF